MKKITLAILMAFLLLLAACDSGADVSEVIEDVAKEVEQVAEQVGENADEIADAVEDAADTAVETAEEVMTSGLEELTVAYFLEWPTPNQFAQIKQTYDEVLGIPVNWVSFDTGVAMSAAMASGDVHIAYSQGLVPFANAVSAGLDLQTVGIAVSYAENDNCVAATDLGITRDNVTDLHGMQVAVPIGTVAHYKMLKEMEYLGVDVSQLELVDLAPADGAAALQRGDVAMACGWGGGLARMKESGNIIMTGAEMEAEIGLKVFDVVSTTGDFAKDHGDVLTAFLQVTEDANGMYAKDPDSMAQTIADAAGMDLDASNGNLATFSFPTADEQLSAAWMGGGVQDFVKQVADFFVEQGELESALDSYDAFVNSSFLENVHSAEAMASSDAGDDGAMMADVPDIDGIKIAIVMPSATTDLAWSQSIYDALINVQGMYDEGVVEIEFTEGMFIVTDAAAALRDYADDGADIVIAHGTQYGTSLFELAPDFPDTAFVYGTSRNFGEAEGLENVFAYDAQADEGGFINGVIAATLSESGTIGVVGPVEAGDAKLYIDGFVNGAMSANPDANVQIAYTGSFGDTALAAEVANTHIASGADVLTGSAQQVVGSIGVAADAGIPWLGTQSDQSPIAPDIVVATQKYDWTNMVLDIIGKTTEGTYGGTVYELTLANGGLEMVYGSSLSADAVAAAQAAEAGIIDGSIDPTTTNELSMGGGEMMEEVMEAPEIDPVQISIVMPSATTDLAWSQSIYDALVTVQGMYDEGVVTIEFTEGMFIVTDAAAALRDYADGGSNIVIAHGTQFGTSLFELSPDFEDTSFLYGTSTNPGTDDGLTNISAYDAQAQQGGYVNGVIAASLSESGIIGVVGPVEAGDAKLYIDGFVAGATATNPDINVQIAYTGSFGDTALAAEVANTHIASGADVLTGSAQQVVGAIGVAAENGIPWLGTQSDQSPIAEDIVVATQNYDWTAMVLDVIVKTQAGEYGGDVYQLTLENGGLEMLISDSLPDDVKAAAQAAIDGIISGEIDPSGE